MARSEAELRVPGRRDTIPLEVIDSKPHPGPLLLERLGDPGGPPGQRPAQPSRPLPTAWLPLHAHPGAGAWRAHPPILHTSPLTFLALVTLFSPLLLIHLVNSYSLLQAQLKCPLLCHPFCPVFSRWLRVPLSQSASHSVVAVSSCVPYAVSSVPWPLSTDSASSY